MKARFNTSRIAGLTATIPATSLDLMSLQDLWGDPKGVKSIIDATGISAVRVASPGVTTSDLCAESAERLMAALEIKPEDIDAVVFVSQTPDYQTPATSAVLQSRLGIKREAANFDINQGCSGYIYGLLQAKLLVGSGMCRTVLVCAGDTSTRLVGERDRSTRLVFGDAGSATIVTAGDTVDHVNVMTDGSGAKHIIVPAGGNRCLRSADTMNPVEQEDGNFRSQEQLFMNGKEVTAFAVREIPPVIEQTVIDAGWQKSDVGVFALHQANRFIVDYLAKKVKVDRSMMPFSCGTIGNTSVASIPVMLSIEGASLKAAGRLGKALLCGFGVGLSWGAMATSLESTAILPLGELP